MSIIDKYQTLNNSFDKKQLTYRIGMEAGFFSEYNNMILAMVYCLKHRIKFNLYSQYANFDEKYGWQGFFEPFCNETNTLVGVHRKTVNWKYALKQILIKHKIEAFYSLLPYINFRKKDLLTQDVFGKCRDPRMDTLYNIQELDIYEGTLVDICSKLVEVTWRYNSETKTSIQSAINSLKLPNEYIGMHIRGGDKFVEHKLESIETYFSKIRKENSQIYNVFILTDDYRIIEQVNRKYPQWKCYTLCKPDERGYFHQNFTNQDYNFKKNQLLTLFTSIEILNNSRQFIGTFSSNPGMFLGMRNKQIATGVDFEKWTLW